LSGPIPLEIGQLDSRNVLVLCRLRGLDDSFSIEFIGFLTIILFSQMTDYNTLSGPIPPEIGQMTSLTELALGTYMFIK
jgi:hypothetical protein